ncbi:hypothetical protein TRFO_10991 [Tritrichomonas foetus]|uniref:Right handed beta helix domain-containing protein n=1 Tax=Tritrichomonas foetus TaxID=1144522 RepID=A0A1J4J7I7_9EUKA|nr:hypothetical protein TRFO_10991 [Tritrichomonas foetus]|eukprot:OHS94617.1 hypothetical protein TRFO_10991 [Tritrichomonas foetus]
MNISLLSLHLTHLLSSPLFSPSERTFKANFEISSSNLFNFANHFLYLKYNFISLKLSACTCQNFLTSAIKYSKSIERNSFYLHQKKMKNIHKIYGPGTLEINNCVFKNCRNRESFGGAIFSLCPSQISNSYFYYCNSYYGGCVCTFSDMSIKNSQATRCSSTFGGCFASKFGTFLSNSTSNFFSCSIMNGGSTIVEMAKIVNIYDNNCSYCSSGQRSSAIEINTKDSISIKNSIFSFCVAKEGSSGISLKSYQQAIVDSTIFSNMKTDKPHESSAIFFNGMSRSQTILSNCIFYKCCSKNNQMFSLSNHKCNVNILNCVFSNEETEEMIGKINFLENNKFNVKNIPGEFPRHRKFFAPYPFFPPMHLVTSVINMFNDILIQLILTVWIIGLIFEICLILYKTKKKNEYCEKIIQ